MIYENILETIGQTPIVKFNHVGQDLKCSLYGKCEFFNPGGSVKDRIGYNMVLKAEQAGQIRPGDTLIEPTSGNTGIGIALAGAIKGYKVIITMPEKMSQEKQLVLEALGAQIYRTPNEAAWDHPDSHISLAKRLCDELPRAYILDQYSNEANPGAHYHFTAQEIIDDMPELDMLVAGVGTGGTISGIAKRLKEHNPNITIVGADPHGSILGGGEEIYPYHVEGIGYDFFPDTLDNNLIDQYIKVSDHDAFSVARQLIRYEGLLIGGSCGAAMWAALEAARDLPQGARCLVILPDSVRNYMSKYLSPKWLKENGFAHEKLEPVKSEA